MAKDSRRLGKGKSFAPNLASATPERVPSGVRLNPSAHALGSHRACKVQGACSDLSG